MRLVTGFLAVVLGATFVGCHQEVAAEGDARAAQDDDGVAAERSHAPAVLSTEAAACRASSGEGCTLASLVRSPDVVFAPIGSAIEAATAGLGDGATSAETARAYAAVEATVQASSNAFVSGDPVGAETLQKQALAAAEAIERSLADEAHAAMKTFALDHDHAHRGEHGVGPSASRAGLAVVRARDVVAALRRSGELIARVTTSRGAPVLLEGTIAQVDDAEGRVVLTSGATFVMPAGIEGAGFAQPGRAVSVKAVEMSTGVVIADSIGSTSDIIVSPYPLPIACLRLRAVPVQKPASLANPILVDHSLSGYSDTSTTPTQLLMEDGMGFTVVQGCTSGTPDSFTKYTARISLQQAGGPKITLASDLMDGEYVYLPPLPSAASRVYSMEYETFSQACSLKFGFETCAAPVSLGLTSYKLTEGPTGGFAEAAYDITKNGLAAVGVADNGVVGDSAPVKVTSTKWTGAAPSGASLTGFAAEGWVQGANGTAIAAVGVNQAFRVYEGDFSSPYSDPANMPPFAQRGGQVQPGGLRWAHVTGTRNGAPFWYTATTPRVIRDRIAACAGMAEDTYYEIPYDKASSTGHIGNGNFDDADSPHGSNQMFAWDFGAKSVGVELLAARGGVVASFYDDAVDKAKGSDPNPSPCGGNYIYIRDQAGKFAVYYHEMQDQISPYISQGQIVHRGQVIGKTGLSGCTSGPHVHFEAVSTQSSDFAGFRSRFHVNVWNAATSAFEDKTCHIVRKSETYESTNVLHVH